MFLHHIGIIVDRLADAIPLFEVWMGARRVGEVVEDLTQNARIQLFWLNETTLLEVAELLDTPSSARLNEFHLCYTVPDLDAEMARLHDLGAVVVRPAAPSVLFAAQRIALLATSGGQLLELLEDATVPVQ